ncbi:MAG: GAF domain-containing protein [Anaerolineales bacterium]
MIERFLRRISVRRRILAAFLVLIIILASLLPLVWIAVNTGLSDVQSLVNVDARKDRLLLQAAVRVASSRANMLRYEQDLVFSPTDALMDVDEAQQLLREASVLIQDAEQQAEVTRVIGLLAEYRAHIGRIVDHRSREEFIEAALLQLDARNLGHDLEVNIQRIVSDSEVRMAETNVRIRNLIQRRLLGGGLIVGGALLFAFVLALLIERSVTIPVNRLREGAEAFAARRSELQLPVTGQDELSLLAQAFNDMTSELSRSYHELEERVEMRTRDLTRRTAYLQAAAEVGRTASVILDVEQLVKIVVSVIQERFDLYYVGLFLRDETGQWAVLKAGSGEEGEAMLARGHRIRVGVGMIGWSIAHAQARVALEAEIDTVRLATPELPETRAEAAIPLRSRGRVIGALTVQSGQAGFFDGAMVAALEVMADQIAAAIDNANLFEESQTTLDTLRRVYGEMSQEAWMEMVKERRQLAYVAGKDGVAPVEGKGQTGRGANVGEGTPQVEDGTTLVVPLKARGEIIGALRLRKGSDSRDWTSREINLVNTLVDQLGMALESARLYQDTQQRAARERLVAQVTAQMRESLEVDKVLQTAAREIGRSMGLHDLTITLQPDEAPPGSGEGSNGGEHG